MLGTLRQLEIPAMKLNQMNQRCTLTCLQILLLECPKPITLKVSLTALVPRIVDAVRNMGTLVVASESIIGACSGIRCCPCSRCSGCKCRYKRKRQQPSATIAPSTPTLPLIIEDYL